jgi:L-ribulose-5-phosphate 3-epimerase
MGGVMRDQWTRREFCLALGAGAALAPRARGNGTMPFKLGIFTDEISQDLDQALDFMSSYSLSYCELRGIGGKNIMSMSQQELERAKQIIDQRQFHVSDIASPIYKWNLPEMPAIPLEKSDTLQGHFTEQDAEALLNKSFQIARLFGTTKVRIFSYWRLKDPQKAYPHILRRLKKAADLAAQNRIILLLENEPSCNVATGKELGQMLRDVDSPWFRGTWDPANAAEMNEIPYPDGYGHVRGLFPHMHIKDGIKVPGTGKFHYVPVGKGIVDFHGQFQALLKDGYHGTLSLETHYRRPDGNRLESTRESLEGLLKVLKNG